MCWLKYIIVLLHYMVAKELKTYGTSYMFSFDLFNYHLSLKTIDYVGIHGVCF